MSYDLELLYYIKYSNIKKFNINHIIIDSSNSIEIYEYSNNKYYLYYYRYNLIKIIKLLYK